MKTYPPPYQFRFAAGPYVAPQVNAGATMIDEWAGEVKVGGFTDAPIPWPAHKYLGKLVPILTGDLVRAVVEESEGVVVHYWGVTKYHLDKWKRSLAGTENSADVYATLAIKRFDPEFRKAHGYRE